MYYHRALRRKDDETLCAGSPIRRMFNRIVGIQPLLRFRRDIYPQVVDQTCSQSRETGSGGVTLLTDKVEVGLVGPIVTSKA